MQITREALDKLSWLAPGIVESLRISGSRITVDREGWWRCSSGFLDIQLGFGIDVKDGSWQQGSFCGVSFLSMLDVVKDKGELFELVIESGRLKLVADNGAIVGEFVIVEETLPRLQFHGDEGVELPQEFIQVLGKLLDIVNTGEAIMSLRGIGVIGNKVIASDNMVIGCYELPQFIAKNVVFPHEGVKRFLDLVNKVGADRIRAKLGDGVVKIELGDGDGIAVLKLYGVLYTEKLAQVVADTEQRPADEIVGKLFMKDSLKEAVARCIAVSGAAGETIQFKTGGNGVVEVSSADLFLDRVLYREEVSEVAYGEFNISFLMKELQKVMPRVNELTIFSDAVGYGQSEDGGKFLILGLGDR